MNRGWTHESLLCPACGARPASRLVTVTVPPEVSITGRELLIRCDRIACIHDCERIGDIYENEPLTRVDAEDVTGLLLGEVAS